MNAAARYAATAYGKARNCAPQPWLMVALLNGVLNHLQSAREAFFGKRRAECIQRIGKATAILRGLHNNLRPEVSQRLATVLGEFYEINTRSISRLVSNGFDEKEFDGVVARVTQMRDAWSKNCIAREEAI